MGFGVLGGFFLARGAFSWYFASLGFNFVSLLAQGWVADFSVFRVLWFCAFGVLVRILVFGFVIRQGFGRVWVARRFSLVGWVFRFRCVGGLFLISDCLGFGLVVWIFRILGLLLLMILLLLRWCWVFDSGVG